MYEWKPLGTSLCGRDQQGLVHAHTCRLLGSTALPVGSLVYMQIFHLRTPVWEVRGADLPLQGCPVQVPCGPLEAALQLLLFCPCVCSIKFPSSCFQKLQPQLSLAGLVSLAPKISESDGPSSPERGLCKLSLQLPSSVPAQPLAKQEAWPTLPCGEGGQETLPLLW